MKRYFFALFISMLFCSNLFSQNIEKNLKLVGFFSRDTSISSGQKKLRLQVPEGKIWKIENIFISATNSIGSFASISYFVIINGVKVITAQYSYSFSNNSIWLKSGDIIELTCDPNYNIPEVFNCRISAFEYIME